MIGASCNPVALIRHLLSHRGLILQLTNREVRSRYRGSVLGWIWVLVQPLAMLAVYAFVFTVIFEPRTRHLGPTDYVLGLFCGIIIFGIFSETLSRAPLIIISRPNYVKNVVFPLDVLPVPLLGATLCFFVGSLVILIVSVAIFRQTFSATIYLFPLVLVPLIFLCLGLAWLLASLGVYLRDTQHGVRAVLQLFFFLTPVVWHAEQLPAKYRALVTLNPMATIVQSARATLIYGESPSFGLLGLTTAACLVIMMAGFAWFSLTRRGFADVV